MNRLCKLSKSAGGAVPLLREPGAQLPLPAVCGGGAAQRGLQPRGHAAAQVLPSQARPQVLGYKYQHDGGYGAGCDVPIYSATSYRVLTSNQNLLRRV